MGINFPPSPSVGTLWPNPAIAGVPQYTWNGTVWTTVLAPPAFYVSDTAPVGAPVNALWWDSNAGVLYINYKDASSTQWVATSATPVVDTSNFVARTAVSTNRIVNGAMQISQEWGDTLGGPTSTFAGFYPADQWIAVGSISPGTISAQRVQVTTPQGSTNRIRLVVAAAKTTLTAGDSFHILQPIEGLRIADFRFGTAQAKQVIVRFGFKGPAGTYTVRITNATTARSYLANFTITAGQANTDTEQVVVIPGDTTGVWPVDNVLSLMLNIVIAAGTNFHGVLGWQAGNVLGTAATSNGVAATNNTFELFDVGLYLDADNIGVPPKWTMPDPAQELALCQRYFEWCPFSISGYAHVAGEVFSSSIRFAADKRAVPALSSPAPDPNVSGPTETNTNTRQASFQSLYGCAIHYTNSVAGGTYVLGYRVSANARM